MVTFTKKAMGHFVTLVEVGAYISNWVQLWRFLRVRQYLLDAYVKSKLLILITPPGTMEFLKPLSYKFNNTGLQSGCRNPSLFVVLSFAKFFLFSICLQHWFVIAASTCYCFWKIWPSRSHWNNAVFSKLERPPLYNLTLFWQARETTASHSHD